jgi:hypothetical protein
MVNIPATFSVPAEIVTLPLPADCPPTVHAAALAEPPVWTNEPVPPSPTIADPAMDNVAPLLMPNAPLPTGLDPIDAEAAERTAGPLSQIDPFPPDPMASAPTTVVVPPDSDAVPAPPAEPTVTAPAAFEPPL